MAAVNTSQAKALIIVAELTKIGVAFSFSRPGETESAIGHRIEVADIRAPVLRRALEKATARPIRRAGRDGPFLLGAGLESPP